MYTAVDYQWYYLSEPWVMRGGGGGGVWWNFFGVQWLACGWGFCWLDVEWYVGRHEMLQNAHKGADLEVYNYRSVTVLCTCGIHADLGPDRVWVHDPKFSASLPSSSATSS